MNFIRPPDDASPKALKHWYWNVALSLIGFGFFCAWTFSPWGFSYAADVDLKIESAIKPIAKEQKEQGDQLDKISRLLIDQLATTVSAQIRLNISRRCKAQDFAARDELNREKDRLQEQYKSYRGEYYREPTCAEL